MATLSQFRKKSKYVVEGRGGSKKNVGDEGTRNIVRKTFGKDFINNNDGGAAGQKRIEKEYKLNEPNNTNKTSNTTSNKTNINKKLSDVNKSNTSALNVSSTKNIVKKDKFSDAKKFQDLNKRAQQILDKSNNTSSVKSSIEDISKKNNISKISSNEVKPVKPNNVIKNVNKPSNTVKLPNVTSNTSSLNLKNNIRNSVSLPNFVKGRTRQGNLITQNLSNYKDPEVDKLIKDAENLKNPKSLKAYKAAKKDFQSFIKNPAVVKKVSPFVKGVAGVGAVVDGRSDYKKSRDMGYNKVQSALRAGTIGVGKYIGGVKGAALGGKFGLVGAIPGGYYGYQLGGKVGETGFDSIASRKGRRQLKKTFTNFMDNLRGKK